MSPDWGPIVSRHLRRSEEMTAVTLLQAAVPYAAPLLLGTTLVGALASALAYLVVYRVAVRIQSARRNPKR